MLSTKELFFCRQLTVNLVVSSTTATPSMRFTSSQKGSNAYAAVYDNMAVLVKI